MSNLETEPAEVLCETGATVRRVEVLEPREVPLGGPRAMTVRRTLPQRQRSLIGAWCFVDHYGPDVVSGPGADGRAAMDVPPHPHTGLQTVSWLFSGEIEHRDSVGSHAMVRPGELNLMTAGSGIQHSEVSTAETRILHGAQLWIALPDGARDGAPAFENVVPTPVRHGDAVVRVFIGELLGQRSPAIVFTRTVAAQLDLPAGGTVELPVDAAFEHGLLVDAGTVELEGERVDAARLGFVATGAESLTIRSGDEPVRALLIGGEPLGEEIVMWWNFVGRSHDEVVAYREQWQREVVGGSDAAGRFGTIGDDPQRPLPAPELPNLRLRPRA